MLTASGNFPFLRLNFADVQGWGRDILLCFKYCYQQKTILVFFTLSLSSKCYHILCTTENIQPTFDDRFASVFVTLFENTVCFARILILRLVCSIVSNSFIGIEDFSVLAIDVVYAC